jgi:DNA-binding Xre family transcriptional regulator
MEVSAAEKKAALKALGQRLEALIYERYKSKEQFLAETGFFKTNLHEVVTGKVDVQFTTLLRLAKALNISVSELIKIPK